MAGPIDKHYFEPFSLENGAAGCLFLADDTKRLLLFERSYACDHPFCWSGIGGTINDGETPEQTVRREIVEETKYRGPYILESLYVFEKDTFRYYNYLAIVPEEFKPILNWEHEDAKWCNFDNLPKDLHHGIISLLKDKSSLEKIKKHLTF